MTIEKWNHLIGKKVKNVSNDWPGVVVQNFGEPSAYLPITKNDAPVIYDHDTKKRILPVPYFFLIEE